MNTLIEDAISIYEAAVQASLPDGAVRRHLDDPALSSEVKRAKRIYVLAIGKAAEAMLVGARAALQQHHRQADRTVLVIPKGHTVTISSEKGLQVFYAGHPLPDEQSIEAARTVMAEVGQLSSEDLLLLLISGGGSALFELPVPGLDLVELQEWYRELITSGLSIHAINERRRSRSLVKGGGLARASQARIVQLLLSDVPGDDPAIIASGPAHAPELGARITTIIAGSAALALAEASVQAEQLGYQTQQLGSALEGDAEELGRSFAESAFRILRNHGALPAAILSMGETTVRVTGIGYGGRNMHLALSAALHLEELGVNRMLSDPDTAGHRSLCIASLGTDGRDGPTDAAGAVIDADTAAAIRLRGMDPAAALQRFDSYRALDAVGALWRCGPTGTNVNDLMIVLIR